MYKSRSIYVLAAVVTLAAAAAMLVSTVAAPALAAKGNDNPRVLPPESTPYGKTYGEWSGAWWRWAFSIPVPENPVLDTTGEYAAEGQSGPVWFLAGTFGGPAERTITVPPGKALFFPIYNYVWVNMPEYGDNPWSEEQEAYARQLCKGQVDNAPAPLACEIDGHEVANITAYRCQTPAGGAYMVTLPDDSLWSVWGVAPGTYGPSVDDGYYLMLAPLRDGTHTIHFSAGGYLDVTYHISVRSSG
jgi:hypothetical protein